MSGGGYVMLFQMDDVFFSEPAAAGSAAATTAAAAGAEIEKQRARHERRPVVDVPMATSARPPVHFEALGARARPSSANFEALH